MSCEPYKSEMYAWRPDSDTASFQPLFDHLAGCPECALLFEQLTSADQSIRRTFQKLPEDRSLESRILAGLAHQRAQTKDWRRSWKSWMLLPLAACILLVIGVGVRPRLQEGRLRKEVATLLSTAPAVQISSTDQKELLDWSAHVLPGFSGLPPELKRVEFRGATAVSVADHKAVLLKMKNERRASLLIVDALLTRESGFKSIREKAGSASLWSDGRRTYVLLYEGSVQEMNAYMAQMGINT
jgi:hypothetical protein